MDYLREWFIDLKKQSGIEWKKNVSAKGIRNQHLGPRWQKAEVVLDFSPNDNFIVERLFHNQNLKGGDQETIVMNIVFGVFDVMLTALPSPIKNYKLTIVDLKYDEINSSPVAFRFAARNATINALREYPFDIRFIV